ncbi:MAG: exodeoxyribonuclease VII small subunit [Clostridia bacterium]|nr:exodeoxyribonuclease VII small subunit [Clostridia bacterium]
MTDLTNKVPTETPAPESKKKTKKSEKSFEDALARLNEIVAALENGTAPLDQSLALYEEGIALVRLCTEKLDAAEQQIKVLTRAENGDIVERDFSAD